METEEINKHGLKRYIPSDIKRTIRKNSGFGCVICGMGIYTYEHVDPVFAEAKEHDPTKMTLLCGSCHNKVTKGIWSKDKVKLAMKKPCALKKGYSRDYFDVAEPFGVNLGRIYFYDNKVGNLLVINEETLLSLGIDEDGTPILSGSFYSESGDLLFEIKDNEWKGNLASWDIESVGKRLIIREGNRKILLQILARPPHVISIEKINLNYQDCKIMTDETSGKIELSSGAGNHINVSSGVVVTRGPLSFNTTGYSFENGSFVALGQIPMNALDFEKLLLEGRMVSVPS